MNEQTNPPQTDKKQKQKNYYLSLEEAIARMKLAFSNAKLPEINPQLKVLGYTETKLDELLAQVQELENLNQNKKKEYAEQYDETAKVEQKRQEIDEKYRAHLALCRVLFKKNIKAISALELNGKRKMAYSSWYQQVSNFYTQLLKTPEFLEKINSIGIQETDLNVVKSLLTEISDLKESQKKETAEAQKATEIRDNVYDELYPQYADLVAYAKVVLSNEQHLEAMGIVVKR